MRHSLLPNIAFALSLAPALRNASTSGIGVDLRDGNSAIAEIQAGTVTNGTHTPIVQESDVDDDGQYTTVDPDDLDGAFVALTSNVGQRVGYKGTKRFIRVRVVLTDAGDTGAVYGAQIIRGDLNLEPRQGITP